MDDHDHDHVPDTGTAVDESTLARLEEIRAQLDSLAEALTDVSIDLLREAIERGETRRPPLDRTIGQARRAVEKASHLLEA